MMLRGSVWSLLFLLFSTFCAAQTIDLFTDEAHMTPEQIRTANVVGEWSNNPSQLYKLRLLNAAKDNSMALDNFAFYLDHGYGRSAKEVGTDFFTTVKAGGAIIGGVIEPASLVKTGKDIFEGFFSTARLGEDIYRDPLVRASFGQMSAAQPTLMQSFEDSDELQEKAKIDLRIAGLLDKMGFNKMRNSSLTDNGKSVLKDTLIINEKAVDALTNKPNPKKEVQAIAAKKVQEDEKEIINAASAPAPETPEQREKRMSASLIDRGTDLMGVGTLLTKVGRRMNDPTITAVGEGTSAIGDFSQLLGKSMATGTVGDTALAMSSGFGVMMFAMDLMSFPGTDPNGAIFEALKAIREQLIRMEKEIIDLNNLASENFRDLHLEIGYLAALAEKETNLSAKSNYKKVSDDAKDLITKEFSFLTDKNDKLSFCIHSPSALSSLELATCFRYFQDIIDNMSTFSLKADTGTVLTDQDRFFYQNWLLANASWTFERSLDDPFPVKSTANLSDAISVFNQSTKEYFDLPPIGLVPDASLWLKSVKNFSAFLLGLNKANISISKLPAYGTTKILPHDLWKKITDSGNNLSSFVENLYSVDGYNYFVRKAVSDMTDIGQTIHDAYMSNYRRTMQEGSEASPDFPSGYGTSRMSTSVSSYCSPARVEGNAKFPVPLGPTETVVDLGSLSLNQATFEKFIPAEFWQAQFLGRGEVYLCYRVSRRPHPTDSWTGAFTFEVQGRFKYHIPNKPESYFDDVLIAARSFDYGFNPATTDPAWMIKKCWNNTYRLHIDCDENLWQNNFYNEKLAVSGGHRKDFFGEDIASPQFGLQFVMDALVKNLRVFVPDPVTGETPGGGVTSGLYFSKDFSAIGEKYSQQTFKLYSLYNHLSLAAKIQNALSAGLSTCSDSLSDFSPDKMLSMATKTGFIEPQARVSTVNAAFIKSKTSLLSNCSMAHEVVGLPVIDILNGMEKNISIQEDLRSTDRTQKNRSQRREQPSNGG